MFGRASNANFWLFYLLGLPHSMYFCICAYIHVYLYIYTTVYISEFCVCSVRACWSPIHKLDDIRKYCSILLPCSVAAVSTCSSFTLDMFQKLGEALSLLVSQAIGHICVDPGDIPIRRERNLEFPWAVQPLFQISKDEAMHPWVKNRKKYDGKK